MPRPLELLRRARLFGCGAANVVMGRSFAGGGGLTIPLSATPPAATPGKPSRRPTMPDSLDTLSFEP